MIAEVADATKYLNRPACVEAGGPSGARLDGKTLGRMLEVLSCISCRLDIRM